MAPPRTPSCVEEFSKEWAGGILEQVEHVEQ